MKKSLAVCFAVAGLVVSTGFAEETKKPVKGVDEPLKVLMIGNSFSICCLCQTPQIAQAYNRKLDMASLYIGGCSLERHWQNVEVAQTNATIKPYRFDRIAEGKRLVERGAANIPDALTMDNWDVVTLQQCSHKSWDKASYHPWGDNLVKTIRELAPQAEIVVQETWSYPPWDGRLKKFGFDQVDMYAKLHDAYAEFAKTYGFRVIPTGTAAEFCPERNRLFTAHDFHFNKTEGDYLQGLVWVGSLYGLDETLTKACVYRPEGMSPERANELRLAALQSHLSTGDSGSKPASLRAFRDARPSRGNTNVRKLQPIDHAAWVWMPGDSGVLQYADKWTAAPDKNARISFLKFKKSFTVAEGDGTLVLDVSADERFYLTLDGDFIARGPNRSTVENWQYQTYVIRNLKPGEHVLEAVVWQLGDHGPLAQLSYRGGFICKANEAYDKQLTTGVADWQVGKIDGIRAIGSDNGVWGTGSQFEIYGRGPYVGEPKAYEKAVVVRAPAGLAGTFIWGGRTSGWMLFPSQLPDQTEVGALNFVRAKAVAHDVPWRSEHVFTEAETKDDLVKTFNRTVLASKKFGFKKTDPLTIPADTKIQVAVDCGEYVCAYPVLTMKGAKGARVSWTWSESAREPKKEGDKYPHKGRRDQLVNKYLDGYGDVFVCDGEEGTFSTPWFRCGRWCRLDIDTGAEPLVISELKFVESRYPVEQESVFSTSQDDTIAGIRKICTRAMQMCDHEMLFDCPYYEQQMYPGDTRVQLNVLSALSRDDRMIKRAIELYDLNTRDDGMCPMNFPTRGLQESLTYTLCYLCMYGDYVMNHADKDWLRARIPGLRKSMAGVEYYENKDGLIANPPGWSFMDWTTGWSHDGTVPGYHEGDGIVSEINLFWLLSMQSAIQAERAMGNELQARYWEEKAEKLKQAIVKAFWSEQYGLFADNLKKNTFSEHAQCLAILAEVLPKAEAEGVFKHLIEDKNLKRTTVYFSYYLFETYFKMGRGDLFLKRLDLWRDYVKMGVTTLLEAPETPDHESRSDCHAWGAHPIWFMQTGLAGIKSDAPFFQKVLVAPCPGDLKDLKAKHPHPDGWITVELKFTDGKATGTVDTPVPGKFVFGDQSVELTKGLNTL